MNELYPLKFKPIFKEKIWGGNRIRTSLGLDFSPLANCGEVWVISGVPGSETKVSNGFLKGNKLNELVEVFMDDLLGETSFVKNQVEFPILVKFIDSHDWLSVQVHPDDKLAAKRHLGNGKSEMWYVLEADQDAELISGFSRQVDQKTYLKYLHENRLKEILNTEKVNKDDVYYIPSGRVHALGPGILLAEIQQTSDTTYRIYDWDRVDEQGKSRELHVESALEAIDFKVYDSYRTTWKPKENQTSNLIDCPYFVTNLLDLNQPVEKDYTALDSFVIYIIIKGSATIQWDSSEEKMKPGETLLIPAVMGRIRINASPECKILEVYVP
jgi:mannose-6-phosphate isomerase